MNKQAQILAAVNNWCCFLRSQHRKPNAVNRRQSLCETLGQTGGLTFVAKHANVELNNCQRKITRSKEILNSGMTSSRSASSYKKIQEATGWTSNMLSEADIEVSVCFSVQFPTRTVWPFVWGIWFQPNHFWEVQQTSIFAPNAKFPANSVTSKD